MFTWYTQLLNVTRNTKSVGNALLPFISPIQCLLLKHEFTYSNVASKRQSQAVPARRIDRRLAASHFWFGALSIVAVLTGYHLDLLYADETVGKKDLSVMPAAVPVVTAEDAEKLNAEAIALVEEREKDRIEAKKHGWIFYEERFSSAKNISRLIDIQQTDNWLFVKKDNTTDNTAIAKKQDFFTINSETPLEYFFFEPLFEYTIYCYTVCCRVRGEGTVTLSQKGGKNAKVFSICSNDFETIAHKLGDGSSFNTEIIPTIALQGNLQVEYLTIYQKQINDQRTICLGTIEDISKVPDIEKANYPDCYYTAKLVVKDILDGRPTPQSIQLLIPAFLDNKIDPLSSIMAKGNWKVLIRPFALAPQEEQEIEQVDEIESYLYTPYILVAATPTNHIRDYSISGIPVLEGEKYDSPYDNPINPPLSGVFIESSNNEIKKRLEEVNKILEYSADADKINEKFQEAWSEKQKKYNDLDEKTIWAKEQNSFFALPKKWKLIHPQKMSDENLTALIELDRFLKLQGILFIIQIVPDYHDIAALVLNPDFRKYGDQQSAIIAQQLLKSGIEAHYLSNSIVENAFSYEMMYQYPDDFHPGEGTTDVITSQMAQRLEAFSDIFPKTLNKGSFSSALRNTGNTWPINCNIGPHDAGSFIQSPYIYYKNKTVVSDPSSKILVFGNSFVVAPIGNGYISHLCSKLLYPLSSRVMKGISCLSALPILFLQKRELIKDKMVLVLPISITYLNSERFRFSNLNLTDKALKEFQQGEVSYTISPKKACQAIFPSSISFSSFDSEFQSFIAEHTSLIALSPNNPEITIDLPKSNRCKTFSISVQPTRETGVSLSVNNTSFRLKSNSIANWEIINVTLEDGEEQIKIQIDSNNSSNNTFVFIGNIAGYE